MPNPKCLHDIEHSALEDTIWAPTALNCYAFDAYCAAVTETCSFPAAVLDDFFQASLAVCYLTVYYLTNSVGADSRWIHNHCGHATWLYVTPH